jgi:hypothetical protein
LDISKWPIPEAKPKTFLSGIFQAEIKTHVVRICALLCSL